MVNRDAFNLTPAEVRVARIAVLGFGNRTIARTLHLSEKTVEFHLSNIYRKLNVTSRVQMTLVLTGRPQPPGVDIAESQTTVSEHDEREMPASQSASPCLPR